MQSDKEFVELTASLLTGSDPQKITRWLETMPERYPRDFAPDQIAQHIRMRDRLGDSQLFDLSLSPATQISQDNDTTGELFTVTVVAYNYAAEFSILTGLLSATGFNVVSGNIYTSFSLDSGQEIDQRELRRVFPNRESRMRYLRHQRLGTSTHSSTTERRIIVDTFTGSIPGDTTEWMTQFQGHLQQFIPLLHTNSPASLEQAKQGINELVVQALSNSSIQSEHILYPVDVTIEKLSHATRMKVLSEDTPFFLYALSSAIALHGLSIEHVEIRTRRRRIEDTFDLVDSSGKPVTDETSINQLKLSVAFTKQFTYFLNRSPDPYLSLQRFESMIQDFIQLSHHGRIGTLLSSPKVLQDLARLLGASDYLWEDFLRLQYESVLPMLEQGGPSQLLSLDPERMAETLKRSLSAHQTREAKRLKLNDFKDNQNYLIDLDHIRDPKLEFFFLSSRLTALAEAIVNAAIEIAHTEAAIRYGIPRSVAGLPAVWALMGLGKLGGEALGYASDIELMFIFSDDGRTDGKESIENREFFDRLFQDAVSLIEAKREGIFHIDLRLRPHGSAGPVAVSLASFARYYNREAAALEKLALVRMRRIGGDVELGKHVESIRNDLIYTGNAINLPELKKLRAIQLQEKSAPGRLNAKFSPGGLVDLEYSVQILQVIHGRTNPALRTPRIHRALEAMVEAGKMHEQYAARLIAAYRFFRKLINGLRMLRGNAQDLFLPELDSLEYLHLARRMGYEKREALSPDEQLHMEFEARSAEVRTFVERELGRDAIPGDVVGNIADLVLAQSMDETRQRRILAAGGFTNIERAYRNWRGLAGDGQRQFLFAELSILAWNVVRACPDPDMALNNWEQFVTAIADPNEHFLRLQTQPQRLRIMISIFAGSQFLSDTLIQNPDFLDWVTEYEVVRKVRTLEELLVDLESLVVQNLPESVWLDALRRFRRREILRIGTRDICLHAPLVEITEELSSLACALTQVALQRIWNNSGHPEAAGRFCVMAFGKLGGGELNYSSDIDLLAVFEPGIEADRAREQRLFDSVMVQLRSALSGHTAEGYLYRVDLRLRPFGSAGPLAQPIDSLQRYYLDSASMWEYQALLKLRPIAGNLSVGQQFLDAARPLVVGACRHGNVVRTIAEMRDNAVDQSDSHNDVKNGVGGIRDIEFLVQGLQMIHCIDHESLLTGNTLTGLDELASHALLPEQTARQLHDAYVRLRRVEHFLQILEDRQVHRLPQSAELRSALAKRMKRSEPYEGDFYDWLEKTREFVRATYLRYLIGADSRQAE